MSNSDVHTLTGAYAANALPPEERDAFERHLVACAACRVEVSELAATASRLAAATAIPASHALRDRVVAAVADTRQAPPGAAPVRPVALAWYRRPATAAAAFLLLLASGLGGLAEHEHRSALSNQATAERIAAVTTDPDRSTHRSWVANGGRGTVVSANGMAVFRGTGLQQLPEGRSYQLWRMSRPSPRSARSAGVLGRGGELLAVVSGVRSGDTIALTVEPASGSDRPTTLPVFLVDAV